MLFIGWYNFKTFIKYHQNFITSFHLYPCLINILPDFVKIQFIEIKSLTLSRILVSAHAGLKWESGVNPELFPQL